MARCIFFSAILTDRQRSPSNACPVNEACILSGRQRGVYATPRTIEAAAGCEDIRSVRKLIFSFLFSPIPAAIQTHHRRRLSLKFMQTNTAECQMSGCSAVASDNQVATAGLASIRGLNGVGCWGGHAVNAWVSADNKLQLLIKGFFRSDSRLIGFPNGRLTVA